MQQADSARTELIPEEGWRTIHATLAQSQSSLYLAGTAYIILLWGAITSVYFFTLFAVAELGSDFEASYPWYPGPLWFVLGTLGMVGSALIGHHEGSRNADPATARRAGIRVFAFWMAVVTAAFLIPGAAGLWSSGESENIPYVAIGVVCLGYVLFGIMYRPALALVGVGMAVAFYVPAYFGGDLATLGTGAGMLAVTVLGAAWIHRSGQP